MKKILLLCFTPLFCFAAHAQFKLIAVGPAFPEPPGGYAKLIPTKNGGAVFVWLGLKREGLSVRIYDSTHKEAAVNVIMPQCGRQEEGSLGDVFEINGNIVILLDLYNDHVISLYRMIIDGSSGQLIREEELVHFKDKDHVAYPKFFYSKDPFSDNYAVAIPYILEKDPNKKLEIVQYGSENQEVWRTFCTPAGKYDYWGLHQMLVRGPDSVYALCAGYNDNGEKGDPCLTLIKRGSSSVSYIKLKYPENSTASFSRLGYNPVTNKMMVIIRNNQTNKNPELSYCINLIDPKKGVVEKDIVTKLDPAIAERAQAIYGKKYNCFASPRQIAFNDDGSFTVLSEESSNNSYTSTNASRVMSYLETYNIVADVYNKDGQRTASYLIPKSYSMDDGYPQNYKYGFSDHYRQYFYINGKTKKYIVLNDNAINIENLASNKPPSKIMWVNACDAFYFPLEGKDIMPQRSYVFGTPADKSSHTMGAFDLTTFNAARNELLTLRLEKSGTSKLFSVIWLAPR